ncbi:hypothetical protein DWB85_03570 [Seongchinamella sediminis]|uniref:HEAT repeat domain-containing protein n=1 Tax=Seongchinamella sediminis TaxID=2283635 RepID=A0A3L7DZX1_9GAMM|nr:HEAT repeat domain-containing protein [Seongchinamella sediminis]RLQ23068.1 hypothetical protein DWB85_03570 [Seongchinamella sediminis]
MGGKACLRAIIGVLLALLSAGSAFAHLDAQRVSLSQLFLNADVVAIALIDGISERRFLLDEQATSSQVVRAQVQQSYKGSAPAEVDFFQDGHGHAHYVPGDTALLFLDAVSNRAEFAELGPAAGVAFVSSQVRNTEHRIEADALPDYQWILAAYAGFGNSTAITDEQRTGQLKAILLRMLGSNSAELVESGLLDWEHAGATMQLTRDERADLLALIRDPARPINLRLAILRTMDRKQLADDKAWVYLLQHESADNLPLVIRSTEGYESPAFMPYLIALLKNPSAITAEAAARALGHPVYAGAEDALAALLDAPGQRLNYAAVSALLGLGSDKARSILLEAESSHPNAKVRRMISARLRLVTYLAGDHSTFN